MPPQTARSLTPCTIALPAQNHALHFANMSRSFSCANFAPQIRTCLPAWERVAIKPQPSTGFTGTIMKRVSVCIRRRATTARSAVPEVVVPTTEEISNNQDARRIRPRAPKYEPSQIDAEFQGQPCSRAEIANIMMQAKGMWSRLGF